MVGRRLPLGCRRCRGTLQGASLQQQQQQHRQRRPAICARVPRMSGAAAARQQHQARPAPGCCRSGHVEGEALSRGSCAVRNGLFSGGCGHPRTGEWAGGQVSGHYALTPLCRQMRARAGRRRETGRPGGRLTDTEWSESQTDGLAREGRAWLAVSWPAGSHATAMHGCFRAASGCGGAVRRLRIRLSSRSDLTLSWAAIVQRSVLFSRET